METHEKTLPEGFSWILWSMVTYFPAIRIQTRPGELSAKDLRMAHLNYQDPKYAHSQTSCSLRRCQWPSSCALTCCGWPLRARSTACNWAASSGSIPRLPTLTNGSSATRIRRKMACLLWGTRFRNEAARKPALLFFWEGGLPYFEASQAGLHTRCIWVN